METRKEALARLSHFRIQFLDDLNCEITDVDLEEKTCTMHFELGTNYCHSVNIVQGGFVTAMLDAVTSHATFAMRSDLVGLSTLELKVSFYAASRAGKFKAIGKIEQMGKSIVFLTGELFDEKGIKTAGITSTAKVFVKR